MSDEQNVMRGPVAWMALNPIAANLLFVLVMIAGFMAMQGLPKEVFPTFPTETITITVPYPGSSPEEVERGIVIKVEEAIRDIIGIKEIRSVAREGVGVVTMEMEPGTDMGSAVNQAKVRVDSIAAFPLNAEKPIVEEIIRKSSVVWLTLSGDVDSRSLKIQAERMREELLAMDGISEIQLMGDRDYELSIEISSEDLRRYNLSFDDVVKAVSSRSRDLPGGRIRTTDGSIKLRAESQAYWGDEYARLPLLTASDGTLIRLGDVARVVDGFTDQPILSVMDGKPAISLMIYQVGKQDVLAINDKVMTYAEAQRPHLDAGMDLRTWIDMTRILRGRIDLMLRNAFQGALLVAITLAIFLDVSLALWVIMGVPFAIFGTLAASYFLGLPFSINILSVFGFILVLGILVDDGIVTAESAFARLQEEKRGVRSVVWGVRRVSTATVFGALTTMIAFAPTLVITEGFARIMVQLGLVVILCIFFSLIETKLILPAHLRHIRVREYDPNHWAAFFLRFQQRAAEGLSNFAKGPYQRMLQRAVAARYSTLAIFVGGLLICASLLPAGMVRFVFFPTVPSDFISAAVEMPEGTPWQKTHAFARRLEQAALAMDERFKAQDPEHRSVIKELFLSSSSDTSARVTLELVVSEQRTVSSTVLSNWIREALGPVEGVRSLTIDDVAGPPQMGGLQVRLQGENLDRLREASIELKRSLSALTGVTDVQDDFNAGGMELDIHVTREGEALGLTDVELARQVRQAFYGAEIQRVQRGRDEVRVFVRLPAAQREYLASLEQLWVRLPKGSLVPFSAVGQASEYSGLSLINRVERQRVVTVGGNIDKLAVEPGEVIDAVTQRIMPDIQQRFAGITYELGGEAEDQAKTSSSLLIGVAIVLLMIFAALAIPLKSYLQPLIIMSVIPFGVIGAIVGHWLLSLQFSLLSMIGIIGLIGVVVNDSLVLVDFINHYRQEGHPWQEAVLKAGPRRFRAVLLTSATTFLGLLPIQMETSLQAQFVIPMATSLAFGILFSTAVTLFLVPTLFFVGMDLKGLFGSNARQR